MLNTQAPQRTVSGPSPGPLRRVASCCTARWCSSVGREAPLPPLLIRPDTSDVAPPARGPVPTRLCISRSCAWCRPVAATAAPGPAAAVSAPLPGSSRCCSWLRSRAMSLLPCGTALPGGSPALRALATLPEATLPEQGLEAGAAACAPLAPRAWSRKGLDRSFSRPQGGPLWSRRRATTLRPHDWRLCHAGRCHAWGTRSATHVLPAV